MPVQTFGVTPSAVRAHHFPQLTPFSTASKPTEATVQEKIQDGGAELAGRLSIEGISADTLADGGGTTYPNAYRWCARYVRLYAAIGALQAGATADPEVAKAWRDELREMQQHLDTYGSSALGDAPAPSSDGNGPITFIERHNLDIDSSEDMSSLVPAFHMDDEL